jgi:hypothetical protein
LRNKFAHSLINTNILDKNLKEICFSLVEFKPRTNTGAKKVSTINFILNKFTDSDLKKLENDLNIITEVLTEVYEIVRNSSKRILKGK